jgi:hypothetical protein
MTAPMAVAAVDLAARASGLATTTALADLKATSQVRSTGCRWSGASSRDWGRSDAAGAAQTEPGEMAVGASPAQSLSGQAPVVEQAMAGLTVAPAVAAVE